MRLGLPYMRQQEAAYAEEVRDRLEKQLHRRARELGYELTKIEPTLETVTMPDGEIVTVTANDEIVG